MAKPTECSVGGCDRSVEARGFCKRHYARVLKYGTPYGGRWELDVPVEMRFVSKVVVDVATRCWIWNGNKINTGYGLFSYKNRPHLAHRWAYEFWVEPIPAGLTIDHLCRVRLCVNPEHLEPVTYRENNMRAPECMSAKAAQATHCRRGHEYAGDNLRIGKDGFRYCRACKPIYDAEYKARREARAESVATTAQGAVGLGTANA